MREGEIIATYFAPLAAAEPGSFHLRDDAALLTPPTGQQLILTTDSVIQHVHVLAQASAAQYAQKLMRRNLSDLAAMGATPWRYLLNLRVPKETDAAWFAAFAATLQQEQETFGLVLAGGDTTLGGSDIHLTLTAIGLVEGAPLTRSGAQAGDTVYVSGTIGDAALGLAMLQSDATAGGPWVARYHVPQPRIALGKALRELATAALDCSDGLLKDLTRLGEASGVGVRLDLLNLPVSQETAALLERAPDYVARAAIRQTLVTGGDDYELIFTAPPDVATALQEIAQFLHVPVTAIGTITDADFYYRDEVGEHRFDGAGGYEY